jgi:hypothetical protein
VTTTEPTHVSTTKTADMAAAHMTAADVATTTVTAAAAVTTATMTSAAMGGLDAARAQDCQGNRQERPECLDVACHGPLRFQAATREWGKLAYLAVGMADNLARNS